MLGLALGLAAAVAVEGPLPFPSGLQVLTLDAETPCPDVPETHVPRVIRTTVGAAYHRGDGTYAWGCPSTWGGVLAPKLATTPDGGLVMAVGGGRVFLSENGGCTATELELPEGMVPVDVALWRNQLYVLAALDGEDLGGGLYYWDGEKVGELHRWTNDFEPFAMLPGTGGVLWVTSNQRYNAQDDNIRLGARLRRIDVQGGLSGVDADLEPLPDDIFDVTSVVPRAADKDEAWIVLSRGTQQWTWHVQMVEGTAGLTPLITDTFAEGGRPRFVQGPVQFEGVWVASFDNELHTSAQASRQWVASGKTVPWTCLDQVGDRVFACTPRALLGVTDFDADVTPTTVEVFTPVQLAPPDEACGDATCLEDYLDVLAAGEVSQAEPASCPDGRTLAELSVQECTCGHAGSGAGAGALLALLGLGRRRRQSPPPRNT